MDLSLEVVRRTGMEGSESVSSQLKVRESESMGKTKCDHKAGKEKNIRINKWKYWVGDPD